MPHLIVVVLDVVEKTASLQVFDNLFSADEAIHTDIPTRLRVHRPIPVHHVDDRQVVPFSDEEVIRIMRRRDLHDTGTELLFHVIIFDHRDFASRERKDYRLAPKVSVPFVLRIDRHSRVTWKRFRACRGDHDVVVVGLAGDTFVGTDNRVTDIPKMTVVLFVFHLIVRQRRLVMCTPVHDVRSLVDQPLFVQLHEHLRDSLGTSGVEGKPFATPVGAVTELTLLVDDCASIFFFPLPHAL